MDFRGNYVALVTPFKNGNVDFDALSTLVEDQIQGGVAGLVPCGTTGESPTLSHEEHDRVIAEVIKMADGRVPVIAGTGSNSTSECIKLTRNAALAGASAALVVSPYYNKPTQDGLYAHFHAVAEACEIPVIVYNIPGRCGVEVTTETILRLAAHPRIRAVKEATGNVTNISRLRRESELAILSGDDPLTLASIALGASGVISVISNLVPDRMTRLVQAALAGEFAVALREHDELFPLMQALMSLATNPIPIKTALAIKGRMREEFRLPLCAMTPGARAALEAVLTEN